MRMSRERGGKKNKRTNMIELHMYRCAHTPRYAHMNVHT